MHVKPTETGSGKLEHLEEKPMEMNHGRFGAFAEEASGRLLRLPNRMIGPLCPEEK